MIGGSNSSSNRLEPSRMARAEINNMVKGFEGDDEDDAVEIDEDDDIDDYEDNPPNK